MSLYDMQHDNSSLGMLEVLDYWWSLRNMDVHTQIPAIIKSIDYTKNCVTVQPLISTYINSSQTISYPQQLDVPVALLSNGKGGAKITIPAKVGAVGLLFFSERDPTNWTISDGVTEVDPSIKDNLSSGAKMYPIRFELGLFNETTAIEWDENNVVIAHGDNYIHVPSSSSSPILINGAQIDSTGNVITKSGTDLDQLKLDFDAHVHGGVTSGSASTSTPTIP